MLESRAIITEGGRIIIPSIIRKELNLNVGEEVIIKVEAGELHISTLKQAIKNAQAAMRKYNKPRISLRDALIESRKIESDHEE